MPAPSVVVRRALVALLVASSVSTTVALVDAMMLRRLTLAEQVREAGDILHGLVAEVVTSRDESGIVATWVTVDVARTLKGSAQRRFTFKQLGGTRVPADGSLLYVPDLPNYGTGDEVVLLLRRPSRRGFTSPVGFADGVFRVEHTASGARVRDPLRALAGSARSVDAATTELDALLRAIAAEIAR